MSTMRRFFAALLVLTMALTLFPATALAAEDVPSADGYEYDYDRNEDGVMDSWDVSATDGSSKVYAYLTKAGNMVHGTYGQDIILSLDNSYTLVVTGTGAIADFESAKQPWKNFNAQISRIIVEEGITYLGSWNFQGSDAVTISIPASVTEISEYALDAMSELAQIEISPANTMYALSDDGALFTDDGKILMKFPAKSNITSYTVPDTVEKLNAQAFSYTELETLTLPDDLTSIGDYCFAYASNLKELTIPDAVTEIGRYLIAYSSIESIDLGDGIETLSAAFAYENSNLKNVTFGTGLTSIGSSAFWHCTALESVTLPDSLKKIELYAFRGCTALSEVTFPESMEEIGNSAFQDTAIETVKLGKIKTFGGNVFFDCDKLTEVYIEGSETLSLPNIVGASSAIPNTTLKTFTLQSGKLNNTLSNCTVLEVAVLGEGVTEIAMNTFSNTGLLALIIEGAPKLADYAISQSKAGTASVYCSDKTFFDSIKSNHNKVPSTKFWAVAYLNGGTISPEFDFTSGYLAVPEKEGYTFSGWFTDKESGGEVVTDNQIILTEQYGLQYILDDYCAQWTDDADTGTTGDDDAVQEIVITTPGTTGDEPEAEEPIPEEPVNEETEEPAADTLEASQVFNTAGEHFFYNGDTLLGTSDTTTLTYNTTQKGLVIGTNTVTVYQGETLVGTITVVLAPRALTISGLEAVDRWYDGTRTVELTGGTLDGVMPGDSVGFTATGAVADAGEGADKIVDVSVELTGPDAAWYAVTAPAGLTVDILDRPSSPGGTAPLWEIIVEESENGTVEVWPEEAKQGTTVTITVDPDRGYEVEAVLVTAEKNGGELAVTEKGDNQYTFRMPNSDVTVEVTFRPATGGAAVSGDLTIAAPTGWVNPYSDVAAGDWYYGAVGYATANGLMTGTSATTFAPAGTMNRAMVWTVIARLDGQTVAGASWAEDARTWAVAQGVSDGTNPDGTVTREELVTLLYRYAGSPEMNVPELALIGSYPDSAAVSDWAQNAFAWALSQGIIDGRDGKLAAGESVTRAEAATILARFHLAV